VETMTQDPMIPSLLANQYVTFNIKAEKGERGRPSGGILFGWKKHTMSEVSITMQTNFYIILDLNKFTIILLTFLLI